MELHHAMTTLAAALSVSGCHRFKTKRWVTSMRRVTRLLQMVLLVMLARSGSLVWTITTQTQVISNYPWPHRSTPMGLLMVCIWIRPENGGHTPQRINFFFPGGERKWGFDMWNPAMFCSPKIFTKSGRMGLQYLRRRAKIKPRSLFGDPVVALVLSTVEPRIWWNQ